MSHHIRLLSTSRLRLYPLLMTVAGVAFFIAAGITWLCPYAPRVHDEFSYLLAADTLLHGRLANPTPEVWQPFQSFHVILEPAYASKYPLGPGAIIAVGWLLLGTPIAGSWLAAGLCAASITWMLCGLTSRRWALFGGLLVALHPAMQITWSQSLMSGWLTAAGAGLLAGGIFRLRRRFQPLAALAVGLGISLLALTRPFEGLVATLLSAALLWLLWGDRGCLPKLQLALRATAVAAVPVAGALSLIALQNYAISGQISRMPYALHEQQYGVAPLFVFGQPQVPAIERGDDLPATIRAYHHGWSLQSYQQRAGLTGWLRGVREACWTLASYWVALALIPLLTAAYWLPFRLPRLLALAVAIQLLLSSSVCWIFPHYLSPVVPWLAALTVLGFRRILRAFRQPACGLPRPRLRTAHYASGVLLAQSILLALAVGPLRNGPQREWALRRAAIEAGLSKLEGRHLVLVKYAAEHNVHQEWVYNGADLARGKVLWARDERRDWNQRLAEQYADDRFIWTLAPDQPEAKPRLISAPHKNQPSGNPSPLR